MSRERWIFSWHTLKLTNKEESPWSSFLNWTKKTKKGCIKFKKFRDWTLYHVARATVVVLAQRSLARWSSDIKLYQAVFLKKEWIMYCIIQSLGRRRGCKMISIPIWRLDCYNQQEKAWYLVNSICLRRRQWESAVENQELLNRHLSSYCEQFQCFLFKQGRRGFIFVGGLGRLFLRRFQGIFS